MTNRETAQSGEVNGCVYFPFHTGSKDKTKPNPLANKLGKNGKLTGDERECHIKEGLCLYCGKSGHVAQDCPKALAAKARAASVESKDSADSKK